VVKPTEAVNAFLLTKGTNPITNGVKLEQLLKRTELDYASLKALFPPPEPVLPRAEEQAEIEITYEGYIQRQVKQIERAKKMENYPLPDDFDYGKIGHLSKEARTQLNKFKPGSLGQANRIAEWNDLNKKSR